MMTIREMRDLLKIYEDSKYDKWEIKLWDYENQRELNWNISHSASNITKDITFPVTVPPIDGISIFEKIKKHE